MDGLELFCFQMISAAGTARSCSIEAIRESKKGNFEKAQELIKESKSQFLNAHEAHNKLLQQDTKEGNTNVLVLMMHAEDQLMSAEMFEILAKEFIDNNKRILELEKKINLNL